MRIQKQRCLLLLRPPDIVLVGGLRFYRDSSIFYRPSQKLWAKNFTFVRYLNEFETQTIGQLCSNVRRASYIWITRVSE